ncbi:uncharacterized protein LOC119179718 isoform X1 [Rhipicephalus microplus]|uniref:uncharacterized protein LOC119179718 isoform X1 n=1 Tax=Rhipicephalus microplus TaxID=6941 RepID=UPI003F6C8B35
MGGTLKHKQNLEAVTMKFLTALLVATLTGLLTRGSRNPYFIGKMVIVNGTCRYRGYGIPEAVCLDLSIPCISVCCKAKKSQLVLTGCPAPKSFTGTVRERDPFWPSCCINWPTSPVAPLVEERSLATEDEHLHMSSYRYRSWN